ncbi:MAG: glucosaminidase domain-containing protein [Streptococcaceae bacterium]|nr:glucosaminidase domain-containing protein [Streptococcaceae bacterium]
MLNKKEKQEILENLGANLAQEKIVKKNKFFALPKQAVASVLLTGIIGSQGAQLAAADVQEAPSLAQTTQVDTTNETQNTTDSSNADNAGTTTDSSNTDNSGATTDSSNTDNSGNTTDSSNTDNSGNTTDSSNTDNSGNTTDSSNTDNSGSTTDSSNVTQSTVETPTHPASPQTPSNLDESLKADSLTFSNLDGFELPLLSTLKTKNDAAMLSATLTRLGFGYSDDGKVDANNKATYSNLSFINEVYQEIYGVQLGNTQGELAKSGKIATIETAQIGDLLVWQNSKGEITQSAIYLGQGKYILSSKEHTTNKWQKETGVHIETLEKKTSAYAPSFAVHQQERVLTKKGQTYIDTYAASFDTKANPQTQAFIDEISKSARKLASEYDLFASVMIAQAILESGSGTSGLASAPNYNIFGVKGAYQGQAVNLPTAEDNGSGGMYIIDANFRKYPNYEESLKDYVSLLRGGLSGNDHFYQGTWKSEAKNYLQATQFLTGKYATDTQYNKKLNSIIAAYHLTQFDVNAALDVNTQIYSEIQNLPQAYRDEMKLTPYDGINYNTSGSYPVGQCTWYVFNRIAQLGGSVDDFMGNGGDWGASGLAKGYDVSHIPAVGDAMSFAPGVAGADATYGHVAFVEAIGPDGVLISESNVKGLGVVSYRIIPDQIAFSSDVTYIAPK